jgi:hypothetical protein
VSVVVPWGGESISVLGAVAGVSVVVAVAESLVATGSEPPLETVAVLEMLPVPNAVGLTTMSTWASASSPSVPMLQITVALPLQLPWSGVAETSVTPLGRGSVTVTPSAVCGPLFSTSIE